VSKPVVTVIQDAIAKADSSYFFEDYTKQAKAVIAALEREGYKLVPKDCPEDVWKKVADQMRTGRLQPHVHTKDVVDTFFRVVAQK